MGNEDWPVLLSTHASARKATRLFIFLGNYFEKILQKHGSEKVKISSGQVEVMKLLISSIN